MLSKCWLLWLLVLCVSGTGDGKLFQVFAQAGLMVFLSQTISISQSVLESWLPPSFLRTIFCLLNHLTPRSSF